MAWNHYKNMKRRVGVHLRLSALPEAILNAAPKNEIIDFVEVSGRSHGNATLRVWSHRSGSAFKRYTVSMVVVPEDPNWIVERY